jgi:hypothetical protein
MQLRVLRRVSRFPARNSTYFDPLAFEAFESVSKTTEEKAFLSDVHSKWHRPSGDNAILEDNLRAYGTDSPNRQLAGDYLAVLKKTLDELRPSKPIIPLTLGGAANHPDFPRTTSPGFPWTTQGYQTKADVLTDPIARGKIHRAWDSIGRGVNWSLPDSLAFHRTVASEKSKTKIRPVWGMPTDVILEEARYFLPLVAHLKPHCNEYDTFYGLGLETALSGHQHLARSFTSPEVKANLNADMSQFDAHVPQWIIRDVFAHVSGWFDFTRVQDSEGKVWNVNPDQTCRRWKAMISYFIKTKIRTPTGLRFQKFQGVPSGSMFTNFMDTCVNAVQMRLALRRTEGNIIVKDYYYGDDSTLFLRDSIDLDALALELKTTFGAVMSVDKTVLTDNPDNLHWLGYYFRDGRPTRDIKFIVASSIFPDRETTGPIDCCSRLLGQLYSCMDPVIAVKFYDAIQYIMKKFSITREALDEYVSTLSRKSMKYLTTLGLVSSDIVVPDCNIDPFGDRFIRAVLPKPSSRNFFRCRDLHLPRYAFCPEAYQNRNLRTSDFIDFSKYTETFSNYYEFDRDEEYFTM